MMIKSNNTTSKNRRITRTVLLMFFYAFVMYLVQTRFSHVHRGSHPTAGVSICDDYVSMDNYTDGVRTRIYYGQLSPNECNAYVQTRLPELDIRQYMIRDDKLTRYHTHPGSDIHFQNRMMPLNMSSQKYKIDTCQCVILAVRVSRYYIQPVCDSYIQDLNMPLFISLQCHRSPSTDEKCSIARSVLEPRQWIGECSCVTRPAFAYIRVYFKLKHNNESCIGKLRVRTLWAVDSRMTLYDTVSIRILSDVADLCEVVRYGRISYIDAFKYMSCWNSIVFTNKKMWLKSPILYKTIIVNMYEYCTRPQYNSSSQNRYMIDQLYLYIRLKILTNAIMFKCLTNYDLDGNSLYLHVFQHEIIARCDDDTLILRERRTRLVWTKLRSADCYFTWRQLQVYPDRWRNMSTARHRALGHHITPIPYLHICYVKEKRLIYDTQLDPCVTYMPPIRYTLILQEFPPGDLCLNIDRLMDVCRRTTWYECSVLICPLSIETVYVIKLSIMGNHIVYNDTSSMNHIAKLSPVDDSEHDDPTIDNLCLICDHFTLDDLIFTNHKYSNTYAKYIYSHKINISHRHTHNGCIITIRILKDFLYMVSPWLKPLPPSTSVVCCASLQGFETDPTNCDPLISVVIAFHVLHFSPTCLVILYDFIILQYVVAQLGDRTPILKSKDCTSRSQSYELWLYSTTHELSTRSTARPMEIASSKAKLRTLDTGVQKMRRNMGNDNSISCICMDCAYYNCTSDILFVKDYYAIFTNRTSQKQCVHIEQITRIRMFLLFMCYISAKYIVLKTSHPICKVNIYYILSWRCS